MKQAIILAAGIGKRLGELTKDIPKCLLPIDSEKVLLDFSLEALKDNGITKVVFISGFAHEKLKEYVNKKWATCFSFRFIFNERYAEYNNIYSAYLAKDIWDDGTILLNSDIIFHPDILKNLLVETCHSKSLLVIDDKSKLDDEDMKVTVRENGEIKKINKNLNIKESFGEYIGILYLKDTERIKFIESLKENINSTKFDLYYEDALDQTLNKISIYPCSTSGKLWTEVDTKEDYEIAKKIASQIKKVAI